VLTTSSRNTVNATATTLEMAVLLWMLRRKLGGWEERRVFTSLARAAGATLVMAAAIFGLMRLLPDLSLQWQAIIFGAAAVAVYLLISMLMKSPELAALPRMLRRG
jgi:peptidoglycan biosynthesis protein MviN/MurJ (putative lipid II flippase)